MTYDGSSLIKLQNLKDGDIIRQSIVLVRGLVNLSEGCSTNFSSPKIYVCFGNVKLSERPSERGEFKFILDLSSEYSRAKQGELVEIKLVFNYITEEIRINLLLEHSKSSYRLQPLYILCRDEEKSLKTETHLKIIDVNIRLVQALYTDRLREAGFHLTTFDLNKNCQVFRSGISLADAWNADEHSLWTYFAEELLEKKYFDDAFGLQLKIVAFIGCTKYCGDAVISSGDTSYANIRRNLKAHAALGGGNLAIFGSAFFYAWPATVDEIGPCLRNTKTVDLRTEPDESNYRKTYLGVYATTLGAICHELGHIFDLGHTRYGIMGSGFDFLNRVLTTSRRTENLPKRTVEHTTNPLQTKTAAPTKYRFTKLKPLNNNFLDNYRDQKANDGFFFSHNSAVVLAHHKWLRYLPESNSKSVEITFNKESGTVSSDLEPLIIVEIRSNSDSLTEEYFVFQISSKQREEAIFSFQLPAQTKAKYQKAHLFVMTIGGHNNRFQLS